MAKLNVKLLGERLKQARKEKLFSLTYVGDRLGTSASTVRRYERGEVDNIKTSTINTLAEILYVSPKWLTGESKNKDRDLYFVNRKVEDDIIFFKDVLLKNKVFLLFLSRNFNITVDDVEELNNIDFTADEKKIEVPKKWASLIKHYTLLLELMTLNLTFFDKKEKERYQNNIITMFSALMAFDFDNQIKTGIEMFQNMVDANILTSQIELEKVLDSDDINTIELALFSNFSPEDLKDKKQLLQYIKNRIDIYEYISVNNKPKEIKISDIFDVN